MQAYGFSDFLAALDDTGRHAAEALHQHILQEHPAYRPFDIKPVNKTRREWKLNFRKKPAVGKALCTLYAIDGALSMRVVFLGFMHNEVLLRLGEFGEKTRRYLLQDICKSCKSGCEYEWRQHYYVHDQFVASARPDCASKEYITEYPLIQDIAEDDIADLLRLIDLQARHMTQDPRDIRGNGYAETNRRRCGDVSVITLERMDLSLDDFAVSDYADPKKLDRYTVVYHLTPMGARDGLWFYQDDRAICGAGGEAYAHTAVPGGSYATVTVTDPMTFSAWRTWNHVAEWMRRKQMVVRRTRLGGVDVPCFVRLYRQDGAEHMTVYVPVEPAAPRDGLSRDAHGALLSVGKTN